GRSKALFDFEYVWEVYKPAPQRRWGYYVLPILYGDQLVGRLDPRLERKTGTLFINGFWLEDPAWIDDLRFGQALAAGMQRFLQFLGVEKIDFSSVEPSSLRAWLVQLHR
ncbi:MAG: winged helix DNA-binding domain-containing protein, partial [Anaerolineales bacterium]|nr:winged helix DNA-binding domain-containing protein [Anaerolineales bacterium]